MKSFKGIQVENDQHSDELLKLKGATLAFKHWLPPLRELLRIAAS
jgi:hypothetical protein